jgi:uncharacterized protein (DUF305 family)
MALGMTRSRLRWVTSLGLGTLLAMAACTSTQSGVAGTSPQPASGGQDASAIAQAKADSARYPYTDADVEFMSQMIGHHAQALVMAGWAPAHGATPAVRRLAERIINGQQDEIASMQRWLRDRGQPVPEIPTGESHSGHHHTLMPGMLTEAQMSELDRARGREFDRLFLTYMIQHHKGAVTMVNELFGTPGAAQEESVFKLASDISVDQSTEIARMERMLAALQPDGPSP